MRIPIPRSYDRVMDWIAVLLFPRAVPIGVMLMLYAIAIGIGLSIGFGSWLWLPATLLCMIACLVMEKVLTS